VQNDQSVWSWSSQPNPAALKLVGSNGQISLGKQYAGRHVLVEWPGPSAMGQPMLGCRTP
jgi:hypothetical protein